MHKDNQNKTNDQTTINKPTKKSQKMTNLKYFYRFSSIQIKSKKNKIIF